MKSIETGYEIQNSEGIGWMFISPAYSMERLHLFIAQIDLANKKEDGGGLEAEGEEIEPVMLSFQEAEQLLQKDAVRDIKTICLLHSVFNAYKTMRHLAK